jgi:antitoxin MazE
MQIKVKKWGNSLALRIPRTFANQTHIINGSIVDILVLKGKLVVQPKVKQEYSLEELISGITPENIHGEQSTGKAAGKEKW